MEQSRFVLLFLSSLLLLFFSVVWVRDLYPNCSIIYDGISHFRASTSPLTMYGNPGCGKTSILAMASIRVFDWLIDDDVIVIRRFIGVTHESTNIRSMLSSVVNQIYLCCGYVDRSELLELSSFDPHNMRRYCSMEANLVSDGSGILTNCIGSIPAQHTVVIILDSLDLLAEFDKVTASESSTSIGGLFLHGLMFCYLWCRLTIWSGSLCCCRQTSRSLHQLWPMSIIYCQTSELKVSLMSFF